MSEMLKRVTEAILDSSEDISMYDAEQAARAAIAAMREPTPEMTSAEGVREHVHWDYSCHVCGGAQEHWYAMIDAALEE